MSYFNNFNKVMYNGKLAINLLNRSKLNMEVLKSSTAFFPYEMQEGDRIDNISQFAFQDPFKDWLVAFSNDIVDPYYDWYLTSEQLTEHIKKKYGSVEAAQENIEYCEVTKLDGNSDDIDHYNAKVTELTKTLEGANNSFTYTEVDSYTTEIQNNLNKRFVKVLLPEYAERAEKELQYLFREE